MANRIGLFGRLQRGMLAATVAYFVLAHGNATADPGGLAHPPNSSPMPLGPPVPSNVKHGAYAGPTLFLFPPNLDAAARGRLMSTASALKAIRFDQAHAVQQGLREESIDLRKWGDVQRDLQKFGRVGLQVSPDRLVYDAVASFSAPLTYKGVRWLSGKREIYVDAESGKAILGLVYGKRAPR